MLLVAHEPDSTFERQRPAEIARQHIQWFTGIGYVIRN